MKDIVAKTLFQHHEFTSTHAMIQEFFVYLIFTLFLAFRVDFTAILDNWMLLLLKGLTMAIFAYVYFRLLERHEVSIVAPLMNLSPFFLLLLSFFILGESASWIQLGGVLILILATYYLEVVIRHHDEDKAHKAHFWSIEKKDGPFFLSVLIMLIMISFVAVFDKVILRTLTWETNLFFTALVVLVFYTLWKKPATVIQSVRLLGSHPKTIIFSVLNTFATMFVLLAIAIPATLVSLVVPLRRLSTLFSAIFSGVLFHEKHMLKKIGSITCMLLGILLIVL
jgi:uncharacterized membrane protein